jgi:hypothetical protein
VLLRVPLRLMNVTQFLRISIDLGSAVARPFARPRSRG